MFVAAMSLLTSKPASKRVPFKGWRIGQLQKSFCRN